MHKRSLALVVLGLLALMAAMLCALMVKSARSVEKLAPNERTGAEPAEVEMKTEFPQG